jgi:hypothetical protein
LLQLIEAPLPKLPREAGVAVHWLAVNGVQPDLPENTPIEQPPPKRQKLSSQQGAAAGAEGLAGAVAAAGENHLCYYVNVTMLAVLVMTAMFDPVDLAAGMQNCCVGD